MSLSFLIDALDGVEIGEHAAQPAFDHIETAALRSFLEDHFAGLFLGADEQNRTTAANNFTHFLLGLFEGIDRLLQIDNVDAVARRENERLHFGVPAAGLMTKMYPGFKQFANLGSEHRNP